MRISDWSSDVCSSDLNGITETFQARGPANYEGSGKVKGFEVAYQQTYDFLPGLLSGLGASASYTYIESKGLPNSRINNGNPVTNSPIGTGFRLPLEQLSKHNANRTEERHVEKEGVSKCKTWGVPD